ncbi:MAG TPA: hypothetical protein VHP30_03860, partial [Ignavibacteriales bacterium]|nr:hypothetical protein [Ignavibacteriales bacterium]
MKTRLTLLIMSLLLLGRLPILAQAPDTVLVPNMIGEVYLDVLANQIMGDTTATGERNNPNRVYQLERGKVYLLSGRMYVDDFSLKLIADDDNTKCPPVIAPFPLNDGTIPRITIQVTKDAYFKNIYFQGMAPNDKRNTSDRPIAIGAAENVRLTVENCIIDNYVMAGIANSGSHTSVFIKDCLFRNDAYKYMFKGTMFYNYATAPMDTISIVNCTYFNGNSYAMCNSKQYAKYMRFEHNTLFINYNNPFYVPFASNADIKNNVFFSPASMGETAQERRDGYYDWDGQKLSVFSIDTIPSDMATTYGVTDENRRINFSNNAYYWPQQMKDFWAANDTVDAPVWMNERTLAFFNNNTQYPNLTAENNVEVDPGFNSAVMTLVDSVQQHMLAFRAKGAGVNVFYNPAGTALFPSRWPIPENLAYTNAA